MQKFRIRTKDEWESYCTVEIGVLEPILEARGFTLDEEQQHIKGERFLMQAMTTTSGKKLILTGRAKNGARVVVKATRHEAGKQEIIHERKCREILHQINFAAEVFHSPTELLYTESNGFLISVQTYIEQDRTFLERPNKEQFTLALRSFKAQEGAHATTYRHLKTIGNVFSVRRAADYLKNTSAFIDRITSTFTNDTLASLLENTQTALVAEEKTIEQYSGFLTHTDFVPHNLRIKNDTVYLLDHSSLTFGNKYEGWARLINFMVLYNRELATALEQYVKDNRSDGEVAALRLMRLYRLIEIIAYYVDTLERSEGDLLALNHARIEFWQAVLKHKLERQALPEAIIESYKEKRDALRSDDEKERQKGLH